MQPPVAELASGAYFLVSGTLDGTTVTLHPVFQLQATADAGEGAGTHRLELRDAAGTVLFSRFFDPVTPATMVLDGTPDVEGPPMFALLVPVHPATASIALLDDGGAEITTLPLGGAAPTVTITSPAGGESLGSNHTVTWTVSDADSATHTFRLEYSTDDGATFYPFTNNIPEPRLVVDFGQMPGSSPSRPAPLRSPSSPLIP